MPEPAIEVEVLIEDPKWRGVPQIKSLAVRAATAVLSAGIPAGLRVSACVALIDDRAIARLNHDFRGMPKPTDVLAFPQLPGNLRAIAACLKASRGKRARIALGDVVVAFATSAKGAREAKLTLADHAAHLIAHGTLHLLGHDHAEPTETKRMRVLERAALAELDIADPYRAPTVAVRSKPKPKFKAKAEAKRARR